MIEQTIGVPWKAGPANALKTAAVTAKLAGLRRKPGMTMREADEAQKFGGRAASSRVTEA
ncbi:MAG: hypothetical protein ACRD4V_04950 [Candidatus Acidiferrales bacterium]